MGLASHLGVSVAGRSLAACCAFYDIALDCSRAHGAEADAQATARLLLCLLREAGAQGIENLADLGCTVPPAAVRESGEAPTLSAARPRKTAARLVTAVHRLADATPLASADVSAYLDLLDRVLMDRVLTPAETDALHAMARRCNLTERDAAIAHGTYFRQLADAAWEDHILTDDEASDLGVVGFLLGIAPAQIEDLVGRTACRS